MTRFIAFLALLLPLSAMAQSTIVSGNLADTNGIAWGSSVVSATLTATTQVGANYPGPFTWNGTRYSGLIPITPVAAGTNGTYSISLPDNLTITGPNASQWIIKVCPVASGIPCTTLPALTITGATQTYSPTLSPFTLNSGPNAIAYDDSEIASPVRGAIYYNFTSGSRVFNGTAWAASGGGGGATSFSQLTGSATLAQLPTIPTTQISGILPIAQIPTIPASQTSGLATAAALPSGATADYNFLQGSGSILTDSTGNGNNGTFATTAPVWTSTGLAFSGTQGVSLPSVLNGTQTFIAALYINPVPAGIAVVNQYPALLSSSVGPSGFTWMYNSPQGNYSPNIMTPLMLVNGGARTVGPALISGFHVLCITLGTGGANDHIYIDGVEETNYSYLGASGGAMTSGNFYLGSAGTGLSANSGFNGTYYRFRTYPTALSAASVLTASNLIRAEVASRGVPTAPVAITTNLPTLHAIGDSITYGFSVATGWPLLLNLTSTPPLNIVNWGVPGISSLALNATEPNRVATQCQSVTGPSVAIIFDGTNDVAFNSVASTWASISTQIRQLKQAGCMVYVGTMLSRAGTAGDGLSMDADKNALNALILSQSKTVGADGVIDFAANPVLGADGANQSATYFQADHLHPLQIGQNLLAVAASNVLNYAFGAKASNSNTTAAATYQMLSSDGFLTLTGSAAQALTLPDCTGPSGETYTVSNPTAFTGSVIGKTSQPINGLATAISIPANFTVQIRDVPNPKNVSGCHWAL